MVKRSVLDTTFRVSTHGRTTYIARPEFPWGQPFEGYARNFVRKNFWRTREVFVTEEDALQECALVFIKCRNRYAGVIDDAPHMMALYKTSLMRYWHSAAANEPRQLAASRDMTEDQARVETPDYHLGPLSVMLAQCDEEIRGVLDALLSAPSELLSLIFRDEDRVDDTAKITRRICRMCRIKSHDRDLIAELRELLTEKVT